jgi:hypothetical protein
MQSQYWSASNASGFSQNHPSNYSFDAEKQIGRVQEIGPFLSSSLQAFNRTAISLTTPGLQSRRAEGVVQSLTQIYRAPETIAVKPITENRIYS